MRTLISWNVNGVRAAVRKGMLTWLSKADPDILCIQETKAQPEQLTDEILHVPGYHSYWHSAARKGYSGTALYTKIRPQSIEYSGKTIFDDEGRLQIVQFEDFILLNAYFPNSQDAGARLDYKLTFCDMVLKRCNELRKAGNNLVLAGDYNIAHKPIDLARPKENEGNAGYLPEERAWMDQFTAAGYLDTFRMFTTEGGHYSWWSYRTRGRERNVGWRLDYHCVNQEFSSQVTDASILSQVMGSDHCPVQLQLDV